MVWRALQTEPYFDDAGYVGFNVAGYELGLMLDTAQAAGQPAGVLTYWGVDDASEALRRLLELGAVEHSGVLARCAICFISRN